MTSVGNYTVPNSISDSNKNLNSFKSIKNTINSSSGLSDGLTLINATNNSSNQLAGANETDLVTFFSTTNFTNVTSQVGSIVEIPCTVHHLGEGTVSVECRTQANTEMNFDKIYRSPFRPLPRLLLRAIVCACGVNALELWDHSTSCI